MAPFWAEPPCFAHYREYPPRKSSQRDTTVTLEKFETGILRNSNWEFTAQYGVKCKYDANMMLKISVEFSNRRPQTH